MSNEKGKKSRFVPLKVGDLIRDGFHILEVVPACESKGINLKRWVWNSDKKQWESDLGETRKNFDEQFIEIDEQIKRLEPDPKDIILEIFSRTKI